MIHSDQGTQYVSDVWRRFCKASHLEPSMKRRANCWDNAVAEPFFGSLKKERIKKRIYTERQTAASAVSEYIEGFYNPIRGTATSVALVPSSSKRHIGPAAQVSTKSW